MYWCASSRNRIIIISDLSSRLQGYMLYCARRQFLLFLLSIEIEIGMLIPLLCSINIFSIDKAICLISFSFWSWSRSILNFLFFQSIPNILRILVFQSSFPLVSFWNSKNWIGYLICIAECLIRSPIISNLILFPQFAFGWSFVNWRFRVLKVYPILL